LISPRLSETVDDMSDDLPSPWDDRDLPPDCLAWVKAVDRIMKRDWCIDLSDAGADGQDVVRYWRAADRPEAFVEWFAEKHDLIRFEGASIALLAEGPGWGPGE